MPRPVNRAPLSLLLPVLLLSACDWVDSAGDSDKDESPPAVLLDDAPLGGAIKLDEQSERRIRFRRGAPSGQSFEWNPVPLDAGALDTCAAIDGFNPLLAADSLQEACTDRGDCDFGFEPLPDPDADNAEFSFQAPQLRASVGLRLELIENLPGGVRNTREFDFCLVAINEAPDAVDDTYVVVEGSTLQVPAPDVPSLIDNDTDDIDVSNTVPLRVNPEPVTAPTYSSAFELGNDGSFSYTFPVTDIPGDIIDTFTYEVTDGVHPPQTATVTLRIVARNQAPTVLTSIPLIEGVSDEPLEVDLSGNFADPEGSQLYVTITDGALPDAGTLSLSTDGLLAGTPAAEDVGSHVLVLNVSDGDKSTQTILELDIAPGEPPDLPPEYVDDTVFSQTLTLGNFMTAVTPEFIDPEGEQLSYALLGSELPLGVSIDAASGLVSGRPRSRGVWRNLRVEATDPAGNSTQSDAFLIRVR